MRITLTSLLLGGALVRIAAGETHISLTPDLQGEEGVQIASADLRAALDRIKMSPPASIAASLDTSVADGGYEWTTASGTTRVRAATPLALTHALERLSWLASIKRSFPPSDVRETPALTYRILFVNLGVADTPQGPSATGDDVAMVIREFRKELRRALRFSATHIVLTGLEDYVPWPDPVYGPRAERYRAYLKAAVKAAHAYRLKVLLYGDEAIFLPSFLQQQGATFSAKDEHFWGALQEKHRLLLRSMPELDGIATRIGEMLPKYDFRAFDLVHSKESDPSPRLEDRYRKYLVKMHAVVSGEFDKTFLHRLWVTNDWEQHSVPEIYKEVFTSEVPTRNLLAARKLTKQDAWYYGSAFNPTFGLTPHTTIATSEIFSHAHGFATIVDFPARWFAAALEYAWRRDLRGYLTGLNPEHVLYDGMLYIFSRLAWQPTANVDELTREYAATAFGPEAASEMAEILLMGSESVRHGLYLAPLSLTGWNPIPLTRGNKFTRAGNPLWDSGRGHDDFLRDFYLMSKPYYADVYARVGLGYDIAAEMLVKFGKVEPRIESAALRGQMRTILEHGPALMAVARDYTRAFLSYFAYRDLPSGERRRRLAIDDEALRKSATAYRARHKEYDLVGIDQTLELTGRMLDNRTRAEQILREAPTPAQLAERFRAGREESRRLLAAHPDSVRIMRWRGTVDGSAVIRVRGNKSVLENLAHNPVTHESVIFDHPVPREAGSRWALREVQARGIAYLMAAPSPANDYTASVYVEDPEAGSGVYEVELCWIKP